MNLFKEDEEEFHNARLKLLEERIQAIEPTDPARQQMLRGCVYRMDRSVIKFNHPTVRLEAIKNQFWKQYHTFDDTFMSGEFDIESTLNKHNDTVIKFPTKNKR